MGVEETASLAVEGLKRGGVLPAPPKAGEELLVPEEGKVHVVHGALEPHARPVLPAAVSQEVRQRGLSLARAEAWAPVKGVHEDNDDLGALRAQFALSAVCGEGNGSALPCGVGRAFLPMARFVGSLRAACSCGGSHALSIGEPLLCAAERPGTSHGASLPSRGREPLPTNLLHQYEQRPAVPHRYELPPALVARLNSKG